MGLESLSLGIHRGSNFSLYKEGTASPCMRQGSFLHFTKKPLLTNERRDQVCFGVTTLSTLNICCGLSGVFVLWKTSRSIGITGKSSGVEPFIQRLGALVIPCLQAELALADP